MSWGLARCNQMGNFFQIEKMRPFSGVRSGIHTQSRNSSQWTWTSTSIRTFGRASFTSPAKRSCGWVAGVMKSKLFPQCKQRIHPLLNIYYYSFNRMILNSGEIHNPTRKVAALGAYLQWGKGWKSSNFVTPDDSARNRKMRKMMSLNSSICLMPIFGVGKVYRRSISWLRQIL